jgi:hypothetical protein
MGTPEKKIFEGGREANTVVGLEGNGVAGTLLLPCVWARVVLGACNGSLLRLRLVDGVPLIGGRATHGILDIVYNTSRCYCMDAMCDILYYTD